MGFALLIVGIIAAVLGIGNMVAKEGWREFGIVVTAIWLGAHYGAYRMYIRPMIEANRSSKRLFRLNQAESTDAAKSEIVRFYFGVGNDVLFRHLPDDPIVKKVRLQVQGNFSSFITLTWLEYEALFKKVKWLIDELSENKRYNRFFEPSLEARLLDIGFDTMWRSVEEYRGSDTERRGEEEG